MSHNCPKDDVLIYDIPDICTKCCKVKREKKRCCIPGDKGPVGPVGPMGGNTSNIPPINLLGNTGANNPNTDVPIPSDGLKWINRETGEMWIYQYGIWIRLPCCFELI